MQTRKHDQGDVVGGKHNHVDKVICEKREHGEIHMREYDEVDIVGGKQNHSQNHMIHKET